MTGEFALSALENVLLAKDIKQVKNFRVTGAKFAGFLRQAAAVSCNLPDVVTGEVVKDFNVEELNQYKAHPCASLLLSCQAPD